MTPAEAVQLIKTQEIEFVDFQFGDLFGILHHFTLPAKTLSKNTFQEGIPFDGSSIRAWRSIDKSDMLLKPDSTTAYVDPFRERPTLCFFSDVYNPISGQRYERDPRSVLHNAVAYLKSLGIGDQAFFGPEPEFFVFDSVRFVSERHLSYYELDSSEGPWSAGDEGALGHKIPFKQGYFPTSPADSLMDFRNEVSSHLLKMGVQVEVHHHEVATGGQCEIDFRFDEAVRSADNVHKLKYSVKNTAHRHGKTATFMPKPIFEDNGSGMHVHLSFWKDNNNLFAGDEYGSLSKTALYAIGGILKHGKAIQVFTNPTVNSYRRLIPGYEAPVNLAYSATNRSAAVRIPYTASEKGRRIEFRCPDSSGSPYLAFAAIIQAAVDGIKNQLHPGDPIDKNLYDLPPEELEKITSTSASLEEAIRALYKDLSWLKNGGVFTDELIEAYVTYRQEEEIAPLKIRPNPHEFNLYYNL